MFKFGFWGRVPYRVIGCLSCNVALAERIAEECVGGKNTVVAAGNGRRLHRVSVRVLVEQKLPIARQLAAFAADGRVLAEEARFELFKYSFCILATRRSEAIRACVEAFLSKSTRVDVSLLDAMLKRRERCRTRSSGSLLSRCAPSATLRK
jgi:hypothetical protein